MINRLGSALTAFFQRVMPDPFLFALLLTFVAFVLALALTEQPVLNQVTLEDGTTSYVPAVDEAGEPVMRATTPIDVLNAWRGVDRRTGRVAWGSGFWSLLAFAMQMSLILVTGYALATTRPVRWLLAMIATIPTSTATAAAMVGVVAMLAGLINWGFGLVIGAVLAKEMATAARGTGLKLHYPLLGAAGYMGLLVWHGGLSGSGPLHVADSANAAYYAARDLATIPVSATLFSTMNVVTNLVLLAVVPLILYLMAPRREDAIVEIRPDQMLPREAERHLPPADEGEPKAVDVAQHGTPSVEETSGDTADEAAGRRKPFRLGDALNNHPLTTLLISLLAFAVIVSDIVEGRFNLDLSTVPFLFLFVGLLLHWRPVNYVRAVGEAASGAAGILLQFPFYAGILGIMVGTGLDQVFVEWIAGTATAETLPALGFLSAALVNMFIPSGGGQWQVQGPIMLESAQRLGLDPSLAVMFVAYGDQVTNMLQPFWALALLGITGLRARDIMGYTAAVMLLVIPLLLVLVTVFALVSSGAPAP